MAMIPKRGCDVMKCETARLLKLTSNSVEPLSFVVPRKVRSLVVVVWGGAVWNCLRESASLCQVFNGEVFLWLLSILYHFYFISFDQFFRLTVRFVDTYLYIVPV